MPVSVCLMQAAWIVCWGVARNRNADGIVRFYSQNFVVRIFLLTFATENRHSKIMKRNTTNNGDYTFWGMQTKSGNILRRRFPQKGLCFSKQLLSSLAGDGEFHSICPYSPSFVSLLKTSWQCIFDPHNNYLEFRCKNMKNLLNIQIFLIQIY